MIGTERQFPWRRVLGTVAVCGAAALVWAWVALTKLHWEFKYTTEVSDISWLLSQYVESRLQNGRWPEANQLYGTYFRLKSSCLAGTKRFDNYRVSPDGPWLQFELRDDGGIAAHVTWEERGPVDP